MRSKFVASRKLSLRVRGPFWAALASDEARLPSRLAAAVLALVSDTAQTAVQAADATYR